MMYSLRVETGVLLVAKRTAPREAAPQTALRDCSNEVVGKGQYIRVW